MSDPVGSANGGSDAGRTWDDEISLRSVIGAVRTRWYVVLPVFLLVLGLGTWRTMSEPRRYRASTTVRVPQQRSPISGIGPTGAGVDYRIDRMVAEQRVIASGEVANIVARRLGLRLRIAEPRFLPRSRVFGEQPPIVDSTATGAELTLRFGDNDYVLLSEGAEAARAPYGQPVTSRGVTLTVPARPAVEGNRVVLEIVPLQVAVGDVLGSMGTMVMERTDIIEISYTGIDPVTVQQTTNEIATAYAEFSRFKQVQEQEKKVQHIARSLAEQETRIDAAQAALKNFKEDNRLTNVTAEQTALQARISAAQTAHSEMQVEATVYQSLLARVTDADTTDQQLRRMLGNEAVSQNPRVHTLSERWFALEKERQEKLALGRTSRNEDVIAIDSLIRQTKLDLQNATAVYLQSLQARMRANEEQLAQLRESTTRFPSLSAEEANLEGRFKSLQTIYDQLQREYQLARIDQSIQSDVVLLLDKASLPMWPVSPNRKRDVLLAGALGLLLGTLIAVLLDRMDTSVRSPDEVRERLDVPVLAMIPAIKVDYAPSAAPGATLERLVTHADPRSPVAESYRSFRTNLAFARAHQNVRTLVLTSPGPADGKSTTVANLAITFAQQGQRTLLIDADLRRAVLDKTFNVPRSPGLTEVIVGSTPLAEAVNQTEVPNLFVLGSGQFPPNPSELLGSPAMRAVLEQAKAQFDVILFDSPPLLAVTDAAVLSTMVDGSILVIRMGKTAREAARRALSQLRAVHARILGTLLNDVSAKSGGYGGYGYTYYAYYGSEASGNGNGNGKNVFGRLKDLAGKRSAARPRVGK